MVTAKLVRLETAWSATPQPSRALAWRPTRAATWRGSRHRAAARDFLSNAAPLRPSASAAIGAARGRSDVRRLAAGGVPAWCLTLEFHFLLRLPPGTQSCAVLQSHPPYLLPGAPQKMANEDGPGARPAGRGCAVSPAQPGAISRRAATPLHGG